MSELEERITFLKNQDPMRPHQEINKQAINELKPYDELAKTYSMFDITEDIFIEENK